jgi:hypothetical protein
VSASGDGPEELLHAWLCELLAKFNIEDLVGKNCATIRSQRIEWMGEFTEKNWI